MDTTGVKGKIIADLKDDAYVNEVVHDEEEEVDKIVPETEPESPVPNSSRWSWLGLQGFFHRVAKGSN